LLLFEAAIHNPGLRCLLSQAFNLTTTSYARKKLAGRTLRIERNSSN
jgi:hypothetical protein